MTRVPFERADLAAQNDTTATMLHVDMDAFFAHVELLEHPELKDKPVIVGHQGGRGVVTSANYPARKFGVRSAMPVAVAQRMCPNLIILPPSFGKYQHYSRQVMDIFRSVTPLVEPLSIDEAFLDVAGARKLFGTPRQIGQLIRQRVFAETGLSCSVGAASTKFIAKMASGRAKPDGILIIPHEETLAFLHPLPVSALWGVGKRGTESLHALGIRSIGDLAQTPVETLVKRLGPAAGTKLHELAWGRDPRTVQTERQEKSIGHERTFERDVADPEVIRRELLKLATHTAERLRATGMVTRTVALKLRFADFTTISRSHTLDEPTDSGHVLYTEAVRVYESAGIAGRALRLVGVRAEQLAEVGSVVAQPSLWGEEESADSTEWREAERAIDKLTKKFGHGAVRPASLVRPERDTPPRD